MNFIKDRALLESKIDDLIKSREEVFNETLQDMLQAAVANYTGKDNSDGPTLPKTPSTSRRLRGRQQRKRKQQNDGSPQLVSRTLRSNANKQKCCDETTIEMISTLGETATALNDISNKIDNANQTIGTVKRSSRQCAVKAAEAISQLTEKKKKSTLRVTVTDDSLSSPELLPVPFLMNNRQEQEVEEISSSLSDDKEATYDDNTSAHHDERCTLPAEQFFTPLVIHPDSSAATQVVSESDCLNETKTLYSAIDEDKYSTPPNDISTGVANEESKSTDYVCRTATVVKKGHDPKSQIKDNQTFVNSGPCVDLALLTKLTPPSNSTPNTMQTPATVIKDSCTENYVKTSSTVIKDCPTSSRTVVETPVTITKVVVDSNSTPKAEEQNYGSPELDVIRKLQGNAYPVNNTTKKQITPNGTFSPAKVKSTIPLEPSGLLYSNHAPSATGLGGNKKLANKLQAQQMQEAKERLAEKNRRDKERLQQLEKKKEQERLEKKRRNQEQLRKVQERQALMLKKKEAQKMQLQQKVAAMDVAEEVKTKVTEKPHNKIPKHREQEKKLKENLYDATWESDEEHYWEEEKRKRANCKDYEYHIQKELEEANLAKTRMCSIDKMPIINDKATPELMTNSHSNLYTGIDENMDYGLDLQSDDSTDEEDDPRKPIPLWAQDNNLMPTIERQEERPLNASMAVFSRDADPVNLGRIFKTKKQRFFKRTSSAQWSSPPTKKVNNDWIV